MIRDRSRAGAEWVSAPIEIHSTPVSARALSVCSVDAAARLELRAARDLGDRGAQLRRRPCCRAAAAARRPRAPRRSPARRAPRPRACRPAPVRPRARGRPPRDPARGGDVVLLDQDRVVQPRAVVARAAGRDRRLLERAQPGRRLARVEHPRAGSLDLARRARRDRRHAREVREEVQRRALARQQRPRAAPGSTAPGRPARATRPPRPGARSARRVELREHRLGRVQAVDHPRRLLRDQRPRPRVRGDGRGGRNVAAADVLRERASHERLSSSWSSRRFSRHGHRGHERWAPSVRDPRERRTALPSRRGNPVPVRRC